MAKIYQPLDCSRFLIAAFLLSGASRDQLLQLAMSASAFQELTDQLRKALYAAADLSHPSPDSEYGSGNQVTASDEEMLLSLIKQKRLSKLEFIGAMSAVLPDLPPQLLDKNAPMRQLVERFAAHSTPRAFHQVLAFLRKETKVDPYLNEILMRKKR